MNFDNNRDLSILEGKRILITGASGFIGQHLSRRLVRIGADVHGTSRYQKNAELGIRDMYWWQGSFEDAETARRILKKVRPDYIFHLAGDVTAANDLKHVMTTYNSLLTSTINLLSEAVDLGCERIILTGSSTEPQNLDCVPSSPYAAAKLATVTYGSLFQKLYKLPVVLLRPFMGYGPSQPKSKLIPHVVLSLLHGKSPKLTSGQWEVDWIYIDDLIDGIIAATVHPEVIHTPLDLGSGKLTSVREVVEKVVDIIDPEVQPEFGAIPDRFQEQSRVADVYTTYKSIQWRPRTSIERGLSNTIEWFKKNQSVLVRHAYLVAGLVALRLHPFVQGLSYELC
ncbi:MAG TPA: NAD(P)-dependent oxidoreductase [Bacteroidales bacterium]|nr:NAD(P)-dependent oxidoreductase [Bacteroidales bacterium]